LNEKKGIFMKKFTIFGFKFLFEVKKKDNSDEEKYSDTYFLKEKVFYLILALFLITISAKIPILFRNNNYMIGDVVKSDIYSPKTIVFRDKIGKDKIIQDMINQLDKDYIYSSDAADIYTNEFDNFHKEIIAIKKGNLQTFDYNGFERKMGKAMPETIVKKLLEEDEDKINSTFEKLSEHLKNAYTAGIYKEKNSIRINEPAKSEIENLDNINILTRKAMYFSYLGFHVGKWDAEKNEVVTDPNSKMYDINLKRAMAYAIDNDSIAKQFYHGLAMRAPSPIAPVFTKLRNPEVEGFKIDLEKAKKLLDDAGYKDVDGDGIREDKEGKPLKINLAMMSGSEIQEPLSQYYIQQWKSIGLNVELVDGRLLDFNNFYDRLKADDPAIDCFFAAFGYGTDPQQMSLFGKNSQFNKSRYTSETLEKALEAQISPEALDEAKRIEIYHNYDKIFMEELPVAPQLNKMEYIVVNKRVKEYDWKYDIDMKEFDWSKIEVTAKEPISDSKN